MSKIDEDEVTQEGGVFWGPNDLPVWVTKDRELIYVKDMSNDHIRACLTLIRRKAWRVYYEPILEKELEVRELQEKTKKLQDETDEIIRQLLEIEGDEDRFSPREV